MITLTRAREISKTRENDNVIAFNYNVNHWYKIFENKINKTISHHYSVGAGSDAPVIVNITDLGIIQTDIKFSEILNSVIEKIKKNYSEGGWSIEVSVNISELGLKRIQVVLNEICGI